MYQFIVNPAAGTGRGYRIWKKLERQLENDSEEYQVYFTEYQGDAAEFARCLTADRDTAKIVVVVGGEGTYNEVLNGLSFKGLLTLGYIPAGFPNYASRGFRSFWNTRRQIRRVLHPKYYRMLDYGVITSGGNEIFNRRFASRCGIGLDAAICHNLLCCPVRKKMNRLHLNGLLLFFLGVKQFFLARPVKGYILLDGARRVEFNHIYFMTFYIRREEKKKKRGQEHTENDGGKLLMCVANSSSKRRMLPLLFNRMMGFHKQEREVRVFECSEAAVHLNRPLAVHVDGDSCMCQQDIQIRCIPRTIRMIGS